MCRTVMSEPKARAILNGIGSPAADPKTYRAMRVAGGWVFVWRNADEMPLGTGSWIVADSGVVDMLRLAELPSQALRRLEAQEEGKTDEIH